RSGGGAACFGRFGRAQRAHLLGDRRGIDGGGWRVRLGRGGGEDQADHEKAERQRGDPRI
ncbi:MAG: hypothetical protein AAGC55_33365, partial [Myxococcota bacterium]